MTKIGLVHIILSITTKTRPKSGFNETKSVDIDQIRNLRHYKRS